MVTPSIEKYYQEADPKKRRKLLQMATEEGADPQEQEIRLELYEKRYGKRSKANANSPADGYLNLWMSLEYYKNAGRGVFGFGSRRASNEVRKKMQELGLLEEETRDELYRQLQYQEVCHMIRVYMQLCRKDRGYNSAIMGLIPMGEERAQDKLRADIRDVIRNVPPTLGMEQELAKVVKAAEEVYEEFFPLEGGLYGDDA